MGFSIQMSSLSKGVDERSSYKVSDVGIDE